MDKIKDFGIRAVEAVKGFWGKKALPFFKNTASKTSDFFTGKAAPAFKKIGGKAADFFRKPLNVIICCGVAAVIIAAGILTWCYVNIWSWVDNITIKMPADVYAASVEPVSATDAVSSGDIVSFSDAISGSDTVSGSEVVSDNQVSKSDGDAVSGSDVVSGADAVSGSDAADTAEKPVSVVLRLKKDSTVQDALKEANIVLDESLSIDTPLDTILTPDMVISIYRLMYVTVIADGEENGIYTEAQTVGALLEENGIAVNELDRIAPPVDEPVVNNQIIEINRVVVVEEVKQETIPFPSENRKNSSVLVGNTSIITKGKDGSKDVTYRCTYVDGILESTEKVGEVVTLEPVTQVIEVGTKRTTTTTKKTKPRKYVVSKEAVYDCDGSGHGYYIITYSDGSVVYQDF